jgi:hypothetical protein
MAVYSDEIAPEKVHVSPGLLDKIADLVLLGYAATSHGGLEIGGLLFGRRDGNAFTVEGFRPLSCDHSLGPRFILSDGDERSLRDLLNAPAIDPVLQRLEAVGWYCSHTRSDLLLLDRELVLHDTYFSASDGLLIIFKPRDLRSVTAGMFLRGADGMMPRCPSTVLELPEIGTARDAKCATTSDEWDPPDFTSCPAPPTVFEHASTLRPVASAIQRSVSDQPTFESIAVIRDTTTNSSTHRLRPAGWRIAIVVMGVIALLGLGAWRYRQLTHVRNDLSLRMRSDAGNLILSWKSNLAKPQRARVDIFDGASRENLNITEVFQPSGVLLFPHNSGNVQAVLTVETRDGVVVRNAGFTDPSAVIKRPALVDHSENNVAPKPLPLPARNKQLTPGAGLHRHPARHLRQTRYRRLSQNKASAPASTKPAAKQLQANQSP